MCVTDNMEAFLTLAERQYIVKYELDGLRAQKDLRIPGLPESRMLQKRDNICECGLAVCLCVFRCHVFSVKKQDPLVCSVISLNRLSSRGAFARIPFQLWVNTAATLQKFMDFQGYRDLICGWSNNYFSL